MQIQVRFDQYHGNLRASAVLIADRGVHHIERNLGLRYFASRDEAEQWARQLAQQRGLGPSNIDTVSN